MLLTTRDLEGNEFVLDDDGDTTLTITDTDDQIDIKIIEQMTLNLLIQHIS